MKATNEAAQNSMLVPGIKRLADQYHQEVRKQKELADQEDQRCSKLRHEANGGRAMGDMQRHE